MLTKLEITSRELLLGGKPFGNVGAYETLNGSAWFAVDPRHELNRPIVDLDLAPKSEAGLVTFRADVHILKPVDMARGNGSVFYNVVNRGRKNLLPMFNLATGSNAPTEDAHFGDGFLMREGYTLAACGWQADVPPESPEDQHLMTLDVPSVPVTGPVSCEIVVDEPTDLHSLGSRYHHPYEPVEDADATLTVRDAPYGDSEAIGRDRWAFDRLPDGRAAIRFAEGFVPGRIYNLVYVAKDPAVMGLGFAATRDFLSFLKYETNDNPLGDAIARVYAYGASQSGRFLRHLMYLGFNQDEDGRQVMDGVMAHVAGGARGSFNHRFAQPSRHAGAYTDALYATEQFPFTDLPQTDPETGETGGLLDRCEATQTTPRIFYTNTSTEYWNRSASLSHTDVDGGVDFEMHPLVRIYHFAGTQHGPGDLPKGPRADFPPNPVNFRFAMRALLVALDQWVREENDPPESRYGKLADGSLVDRANIVWPSIPHLPIPKQMRQPLRYDWGARWVDGVIDREPPGLGKPYAVRVPGVDADGNEVAGVLMPEVAVPLGTFTGWRFRTQAMGAPDALAGLSGVWAPFARTDAEGKMLGDVRLSAAGRYRSREDYVAQVERVAQERVSERLMLDEDVSRAAERAAVMYDWVMEGSHAAD